MTDVGATYRKLIGKSEAERYTLRQAEDWATLNWRKLEANVARLQRRIYRAKRCGDVKRVHNLQRLLLRSYSARCLAVRRVTQDNRGKKTAGIDGVKDVSPLIRMAYVHLLRTLKHTVSPVRRVSIPKPNQPAEKRPLGIPTMLDRAYQALVKLAIEPEWEAEFEANSYGFRPGRSGHDAIEAIFNHICRQPKYVLDADIEKCFDRINHEALLAKINTIQPVMHLLQAWLKAGVIEAGRFFASETGTPQGGVISPLLANIALHGLESHLKRLYPTATIVRYADDFVILCANEQILVQVREEVERWLSTIGLRLKPSKTRTTHTFHDYNGETKGFDFLGFTICQHPVGKYQTYTYRGKPGFKTLIQPSLNGEQRHLAKLKTNILACKAKTQGWLITTLNPQITGWANYYRTSVAKRTFARVDRHLDHRLTLWSRQRHPHHGYTWCRRRYWRPDKGNSRFSDGRSHLRAHADTPIRRHIKVQGNRSPFDGDWLYWGTRLGKDPTKPDYFTALLKTQQGRCKYCGAPFMTQDIIEVHHKNGNHHDNYRRNLELLHGHCHDQLHAAFATTVGIVDNDRFTEEPCARKPASTVLKQRREG
jgi:RNA-directed DNA polymerase